MPRKPTPSILSDAAPAEPIDEIFAPVVEPAAQAVEQAVQSVEQAVQAVELAPPPATKPAKPRVKKAAPELKEIVPPEVSVVEPENMVEPAPASPAPEDSSAALPVEEAPAKARRAAPEILITLPVPIPDSMHGPLRVVLLASLGAVSYAIEESIYLMQVLVERGELSQKETMKMIGEQRKKAKLPLPKFMKRHKKEAQEEAAAADMPASDNPGTDASPEPGDPDKAVVINEFEIVEGGVEGEENQSLRQRPMNIYTVNFLSFGSPVNVVRKIDK